MKKVLIVGSKGMLAGYLAEVFKDHDVSFWDRDEIDITQKDEVIKRISELKPEIVINCAAYNNVDKAEEEFELAKMVTGYAVGFLAAAAKKVGAIFVHYSTDYVFAGTARDGYTEDAVPSPISKYGESKYLGEQELVKNCEQYYIIRLSKLFGRVGSGQGAKKSFVDKILEVAETKEEIEVVDEEFSSPTYAADLAEYTKAILDDGQPFGVYHGANSGGCTWYDLAAEVFRIKNINKKLIPVSGDKFARPAARPQYSVLLNTKFVPIRSWQEALQEYLENDKK